MANPNAFDQLSRGTGSFIEEFKAFALKGNIIDLAVAVVIGAAFKELIDSFVANFIDPLIALVIPDVENLAGWQLGVFGVGAFLASVISFLVISLVLFIVIKKIIGAVQNLRAKEEVDAEAEATAPSAEEKLLTEIRDLLKAQSGPSAS